MAAGEGSKRAALELATAVPQPCHLDGHANDDTHALCEEGPHAAQRIALAAQPQK